MSLRKLLSAFSRHRADSDLLGGPIRGELLGAEGLAEHARTVARHQHLRPPRRLGRVGPLLNRLDGTLVILEEAHAQIAGQPSALDIGPAGEWLLDNFYVVRDHIADVRQNLPRGYYGELPDLSDGPLAPAELYPRMTFETRDQYRHVIERLARRTGRPEAQVATTAVELAQRSSHDGPDAHVGFFLLGSGRTTLEQTIGYRPPLGERLLRAARRHPDLTLAGSAMLVTGAALAAILLIAGADTRRQGLLLVLLALLPANEVALNLIQQLVTSFLQPQRLPKLDFRKTGVPTESRTAVVIPTLFANVGAVVRPR